MDQTLEYFEQYRQKRVDLEQIKQSQHDLKIQLEKLYHQSRMMSEELLGMQKIITYMIENGMDPVEAKLKSESIDRHDNFWINESTIKNSGTISMAGVVGGGYSISMTGATGAIGATHLSTPSYSSGLVYNSIATSTIGQSYIHTQSPTDGYQPYSSYAEES